ncbi:MAG TPA: acyltransferase family protein [Smithellaceae bacterium]|nr:acyltransferase family protein [Smithellaceae bacterium]HRS88146.1 acyltransferase family protein [Smithellaceae bacterium]HRV25380.1 acyltransferase family protein [Smithellaceae bacterium]
MKPEQNRIVYLDNLRNVLVYNVVVYHAMLAFAYPILFWWATVDKEDSARIFETAVRAMYIYMMPCMIFIAALFILPSLKKAGSIQYIKKRFLRLYVPVIVFVFCMGDVFPYLMSKRIGNLNLTYQDTFISFWRSFIDIPLIFMTDPDIMINQIHFDFYHTWFLTLLFFVTIIVVLLNLLFRKKPVKPVAPESRKKVITKTILFALTLSVVYVAVSCLYLLNGILLNGWTMLGKAVFFENIQIWMLIPLFAFGLYVYKKDWHTLSDIGSWKMWGALTVFFFGLYIILVHFIYLPGVEEMYKAVESNTLSGKKMEMPALNASLLIVAMLIWFLSPLSSVFILMFLLAFAKKFFNRPNLVTDFCSRHSINVYILHYIPILLFQHALLDVPIAPFFKIILMVIIIIPACLWLSHRLVFPYPKTAILFFVALKLAALAMGFEFYYWAILAIIFISFAAALYEFAKFMINRSGSKDTA